jgi:hypothetical protein
MSSTSGKQWAKWLEETWDQKRYRKPSSKRELGWDRFKEHQRQARGNTRRPPWASTRSAQDARDPLDALRASATFRIAGCRARAERVERMA